MFLLITGASGAGKSTVRRRVAKDFADVLEATELAQLGVTPQWNLSWRHEMVERVVQQAIRAQRQGKHFLLCGDPVPPGEVHAAPSSDQLEGGLEVCLLDIQEAEQRRRLMARGDDPGLLHRHVAFADWMREHVADPRIRPEVIMQDAWDEMQWERWLSAESPPWTSHVIDTTDRDPDEVCALASTWIRDALARAAMPSEPCA